MARWRAEAQKRLPELREAIESSDEILAFWIEARLAFERAYARRPRDESLIERIYLFADWCASAPRGRDAGRDPLTAVVVGFYEDIPTIAAAREDMPRWFTAAEIARSKQIFAYHIGEAAYLELLHHVRRNGHLYRPRVSQIGDS